MRPEGEGRKTGRDERFKTGRGRGGPVDRRGERRKTAGWHVQVDV